MIFHTQHSPGYRAAWGGLSAAPPARLRSTVLESEPHFRQLEARFTKTCDFLMSLLESALRQNVYPHLGMLHEALKGVGAYPPIWG